MPRVSVIIPTYNRAELLLAAIQSVLAQTMSDWELIVVDDGSTDNTREVVARFVDPRVRYVRQENRGRSVARNRAITLARAPYLAFLDSDDLFTPHKLQTQCDYLDTHTEIGATIGAFSLFEEGGREFGSPIDWNALNHPSVSTWLFHGPAIPDALVVRKSCLERIGGFDRETETAEDWDLVLRLAADGCQFAWIKEIVCRYRIHAGNSVNDIHVLAHRCGMLRMFEKFFNLPNLSPDVSGLRNRVLAEALLTTAGREYAVGLLSEAKADVEAAIALDSSFLSGPWESAADRLFQCARDPVLSLDPFTYAESVFANLPASAAKLARHRKQALARLAASMLFAAHQQNDGDTIRRSLCIMLRNDPRWFINRGVLSIAARTWLPRVFGSRKIRAASGNG